MDQSKTENENENENANESDTDAVDSAISSFATTTELDDAKLKLTNKSTNVVESIEKPISNTTVTTTTTGTQITPAFDLPSSTLPLPLSSPTSTPFTDPNDIDRICWICFATDEDNKLAAWVQPCKCRGTTKWVHQSCLYRWVDEKQKGNALRSVTCQQCQTEYIIIFPHIGKIANALERFDNLIKRLSPFVAAGVLVGSLYWAAVTYGAVTVLQIVGHKKGLALMENGDAIVLLIGLPAIPVGLILGRLIRWEDAIVRLIRNRRNVARKFPLMNLIIPYPDEDNEPSIQNPITPTLTDPVSGTRIFCGALLLPTISSIVGKILFESIENTLHRTLLGGLTFITVKGILKIYLKHQQYNRKTKRKIIDYTEENIRVYVHRNSRQQHTNSGHNNNIVVENIV